MQAKHRGSPETEPGSGTTQLPAKGGGEEAEREGRRQRSRSPWGPGAKGKGEVQGGRGGQLRQAPVTDLLSDLTKDSQQWPREQGQGGMGGGPGEKWGQGVCTGGCHGALQGLERGAPSQEGCTWGYRERPRPGTPLPQSEGRSCGSDAAVQDTVLAAQDDGLLHHHKIRQGDHDRRKESQSLHSDPLAGQTARAKWKL